jgi:hypothetical protein
MVFKSTLLLLHSLLTIYINTVGCKRKPPVQLPRCKDNRQSYEIVATMVTDSVSPEVEHFVSAICGLKFEAYTDRFSA